MLILLILVIYFKFNLVIGGFILIWKVFIWKFWLWVFVYFLVVNERLFRFCIWIIIFNFIDIFIGFWVLEEFWGIFILGIIISFFRDFVDVEFFKIIIFGLLISVWLDLLLLDGIIIKGDKFLVVGFCKVVGWLLRFLFRFNFFSVGNMILDFLFKGVLEIVSFFFDIVKVSFLLKVVLIFFFYFNYFLLFKFFFCFISFNIFESGCLFFIKVWVLLDNFLDFVWEIVWYNFWVCVLINFKGGNFGCFLWAIVKIWWRIFKVGWFIDNFAVFIIVLIKCFNFVKEDIILVEIWDFCVNFSFWFFRFVKFLL